MRIAGRVADGRRRESLYRRSAGEEGKEISREQAEAIQNAGVNEVMVETDGEPFRVIGNNFGFIKPFLAGYDPELLAQYDESCVSFHERVHLPSLVAALEDREERTAFR